MRRLAVAVAIVSALLAGCASVPSSSPVQVLRQFSGAEVVPPPEPTSDSYPTELVRDFITASATSTDRHGAARRFLTPEAAQSWDDGASLTVVEGLAPIPSASTSPDTASIRIRGVSRLGDLDPDGSFRSADESPFSVDVDLVRRDGQWRISRLPSGVVVEQSAFRLKYRPVNVWFVDPARRLVVPDQRYIAVEPVKTQPARLVQLLLDGPARSPALGGAVSTELPSDARLHSNVGTGADNTVTVDLTGLGTLGDAARRLLAAQVVLTLTGVGGSGVNITRVTLLVDGQPLIPEQPDWTRQDAAQFMAEASVADDAPALVVSAGRIAKLTSAAALTPFPGPAGDGRIQAQSAAVSADQVQLAVVARGGSGVELHLGKAVDGTLGAPVVSGTSMTLPTWTPTGDEVWTVVDGARVARVRLDDSGPTVTDVDVGLLRGTGPITELRLFRDGVRVLVVAGGGLYVGALVRRLNGTVAISDVDQVRPTSLATVTAADWVASDQILVAATGPRFLVAKVQTDGLALTELQTNTLSSPVTAVAATSPDRPLLAIDPSSVWSFTGGPREDWRPVSGGTPGSVASYPG